MLTGGKTKGAHPTESTAKLAFFIHTAKYPLHIAPLSSVFSIFPHLWAARPLFWFRAHKSNLALIRK